MNATAAQIIDALRLEPLEFEGGWFRRTWAASETLPAGQPDGQLGGHESSERLLGTAIYYLLTRETVSRMHRLPGAEIFHFYAGSPVNMLQLDPKNGQSREWQLGPDVLAGQHPQVIVPGGVWQGCMLADARAGDDGMADAGVADDWALMGATMAPGFDLADFERGQREVLSAMFPEQAEQIILLTP